MVSVWLFFAFVVGMCISLAVVLWRVRRSVEEAKQGYKALTQGADVELGLLRTQVERAREERDAAKRKSDEFFRMIEVANSERDGWRQLYIDQSAAHSNAQALMLTQINTLAILYEKETKKKPQIAPIIQAVSDDFLREHGHEAVQARLAK